MPIFKKRSASKSFKKTHSVNTTDELIATKDAASSAPPTDARNSADADGSGELICKLADTPDEIEQVHRLNYRTFVEEIPQHPPNPERRLVDKFHHENLYLVVKQRERVVGMMALRDKRPFSMDAKIPDLDRHMPPHNGVLEIRLLAVERDFRGRATFRMMMEQVFVLAKPRGWDLAIISATVRQLKLYKHLGFEPFGPLVGTGDAQFQPMFLRGSKAETVRFNLAKLPSAAPDLVPLIPGPVPVSPRVRAAMGNFPLWHRSEEFYKLLFSVRTELCRIASARHCQVVPGSGTLVNDMVSWQLRQLRRPGVVFVNGEFGSRIAGQARRAELDHQVVSAGWGRPFDRDEMLRAFDSLPSGGWVWGVHHETSTSILNPLDEWKELARDRGLRLCVDTISSMGNVPLSLDGVHLATAVSSKGLCSYPGLGVVFHHEPIAATPRGMPSYLDVGYWQASEGVAFTHSSNLVAALAASLGEQDFAERHARIAALSEWLCGELKSTPYDLLAPKEHACPAVITLVPHAGGNAWATGEALEKAGFLLSYRSAYLRDRNWIQISLMGLPDRETLAKLVTLLREGV